MKHITTTALLVLAFAQPGFSGGLGEPLVEQEVIGPEDTMTPEEVAAGSDNSGGFFVPLLIFAAIAAALSASGGGDGVPTGGLPPPPIK